jgi:pyruvate formate lyase activating enzyme
LNAKPLYDITPFTHIDYPGKLAAIAWFTGCNMRCPYCHNPEIVRAEEGRYSFEDLLEFLSRRRGLLDGVVLSGGEATLHDLPPLCREIRRMGFAVKLDTNGGNPGRIRILLEEGLLDAVALDFKAPRSRFRNVTGSGLYDAFLESLGMLLDADVALEIRTTLHPELLDPDTLLEMQRWLRERGYPGRYTIQECVLPPEGPLGEIDPAPIRREDYPLLSGVRWRTEG